MKCFHHNHNSSNKYKWETSKFVRHVSVHISSTSRGMANLWSLTSGRRRQRLILGCSAWRLIIILRMWRLEALATSHWKIMKCWHEPQKMSTSPLSSLLSCHLTSDASGLASGLPGVCQATKLKRPCGGEDRRVDLAENHWEKQLEWRVDVKSSVGNKLQVVAKPALAVAWDSHSKTFPNSSSSGHEWHNILAAHYERNGTHNTQAGRFCAQTHAHTTNRI